MLTGVLPLIALSSRIGVMAMGEDEARAPGVETGRPRLIVILCATLLTATAVPISGIIGWIGVMVSQMPRFRVGARFDRLLPVSLSLGATLLVPVETAARSVATMAVPLGVLTALIGAPVSSGCWRGGSGNGPDAADRSGRSGHRAPGPSATGAARLPPTSRRASRPARFWFCSARMARARRPSFARCSISSRRWLAASGCRVAT
jgi:hypothetical protein